ncbi:MAG: hypothetical protein AB8W37_12275 [Arsenophonus endosymbiont of Dermacentor nuttalli]
MRLDPQAFDKIIIGFAAIVGDKGNKKATIDRAAKDYQRKNNEQLLLILGVMSFLIEIVALMVGNNV